MKIGSISSAIRKNRSAADKMGVGAQVKRGGGGKEEKGKERGIESDGVAVD